MNALLQGFRHPQPAVLATGLGPEFVRGRRVPSRHVHPIGHMPHRHLDLRPSGKERFEEMTAYLPMQTAYPVDSAATANRQIGHIKTLGGIIRILPSQGQKVAEADA